ncbi:MAG TPA: hypothetical protein PLL66_00735 [Bacteroidales bacterium]|nr:hypothetical protein [Bacteroidales bacterium]
MKSRLFFLVFFFIIIFNISHANAQTLYFCEGVDYLGNPTGSSDVFNIGADGGYFYFLVKLQEPVGCTNVDYILYDINFYGGITYNTTIEQVDIDPNWSFFWQKVTFYNAGTYQVSVRDCYGDILTSSTVKIKMK